MQKQPVKLALHQLSTETVEQQLENQENDNNIPRTDLYFTNMKELFCILLQSNITKKMHCGMLD